MSRVNDLVDALEERMAARDDRDVAEYRRRHPENIVALDALRDVLTYCDLLDYAAVVAERVPTVAVPSPRLARSTASEIRTLVADRLRVLGIRSCPSERLEGK